MDGRQWNGQMRDGQLRRDGERKMGDGGKVGVSDACLCAPRTG
jgi:hypothetical protein